MNSHEIEGLLEAMSVGETQEIEGITVSCRYDLTKGKRHFSSWNGGAVSWSYTARAAAKKIVWLRNRG